MRVFRFAPGAADGNADQRDLLGGKGANLAEMCRLGVPVPPGFTLPTTLCRDMLREGRLTDELPALVDEGLAHVERATGKRFGDAENPLLVSVRSGAPASMPGMMETVLNLGLSDEIAARWAARTNAAPVVWDAYRRFLQMYADVVLGIGDAEDESPFERLLDEKRRARGVHDDSQLSADDLRDLTSAFQALIAERSGRPLSQDPREHLLAAVTAVFESWNTKRAIAYRELHAIPHDMGTACTVQAMVFGDLDDDSGTGVAFTRNPSTGERSPFGEFLVRAQGEDVVAGIRTPDALHARQPGAVAGRSLEEKMPRVYEELSGILEQLERHFADVQDVELTVEGGRLWILQTRSAKRSARAAVRVAVELVQEGVLDEKEALLRVKPESVTELLLPALDEPVRQRALSAGALLANGLPASPGVGKGVLVLRVDEAVARTEAGEAVVLVRPETSADDIRGMHAAKAIVTARGGMTSHAAVVARGMGRPCVAGVGSLAIDARARTVRFGERELHEGDWLTVDGTHGEVFAGALETTRPGMPAELKRLLSWADDVRRLGVRANADTPNDASRARALGAEGIGLCRTEHMFFAAERIVVMRELILAEEEPARRAALDRLRAMQREDFAAIFRAMSGLPVTIRLLDPPLHEFLPSSDEEVAAVARDLGVSVEAVRAASERHREANPMLGHRGCRLSLTFPEITEMQTRAALEGASLARGEGAEVALELMVPLVADVEELARVKRVIEETVAAFEREQGVSVPLLIGTMIELPRACLLAGAIATEAEFFSFGTNDLTQTTFGLSRDDAGRFLPAYVSAGVLAADPFEHLDEDGVGELVRLAVSRGRAARADLEVGICGEHGGDPASIRFCERVGMDYVSCSPWRVPVARLAAAQARLVRSVERR